jgi:hypothetical protein
MGGIDRISSNTPPVRPPAQVDPAQSGITAAQDAGARLDQDIKQLGELIKNAIASHASPDAVQQLVSQLNQLQQLANSASTDGDGAAPAIAGPTTGGAALDLAKKLTEIEQQIAAISNSMGLSGGSMSQNPEKGAISPLGQDQNQAQGRDFMAAYPLP